MKTVAFTTVDVFTSTRFEGNPLAVMADARGLADTDMQNIAAEFGYSEVTFVLPPEDPANTARVRIFTPTMEVPFAGHPNVGTAYVLGQQGQVFGRPVGDSLRFEEKAGLVEVDLKRSGNEVLSASIRAPKRLAIGNAIPEQTVARCIAIEPQEIRLAKHRPVLASVGLSFVVAELADLAALGRARPNLAYFQDAARQTAEGNHDFSLFVYVRSQEEPWTIRARMFAPLDNVPEDPATGSASAALGAYLVSLEPDANMNVSLTIEQGVEMGRRSSIGIDVIKKNGIVTDVTISGSCTPAMRGEVSY
ncbi:MULTISPECIES: PhzF family phenazine biosynthesis protein [unclassified Rhizobium]|uniref:PhzF family phenazine biosynthesis protein n=1 Tax=unclassified Rhizobium TaxID=2613769 RepID=UPI00104E3AE6|nr:MULTISPECIES: PhzF family phenazine biosynthesis protein [unclassified Rhizobium]MBB3395146.1 trans-2,3-dihydro-3-hydroxyanthranilate isomerase [Rhizobium sp. BK060]MBB4167264.1 trans-2,3-dihydro-3-hydroxyanthranilate isomerase [Rhizobium sp. BK538]TCM78046.1 trans-2,3-dihydro-3-hydroxyanthranilate isomerase [Rhizobium sp. BK068]